jgi:predicted nuclease of predicted toxin-antitoxin system
VTERFLADENFPTPASQALRVAGYDAAAVSDLAARALDSEVLAFAQSHDRVLLTCDKDFGTLVFRGGATATSGAVLFRLNARSLSDFIAHVTPALARGIAWRGYFTVITRRRMRRRPLR